MIGLNIITFIAIICIWFLLAEIVRKEEYQKPQKLLLFFSAATAASVVLAVTIELNLNHMIDKTQYYKCVHVHEHSLKRPPKNSIRWRKRSWY